MTVLAFICAKSPRLRGPLLSFHQKPFPKLAEVSWQELEQASSGQPCEDSGASREKEQQRFRDVPPSSDVPPSIGNTGPSLEDWPWGIEVCGPPQHRCLCVRESGRGKFGRVTTQRRKPEGVGGWKKPVSGSSQGGDGGKRRQEGGALGAGTSFWDSWRHGHKEGCRH